MISGKLLIDVTDIFTVAKTVNDRMIIDMFIMSNEMQYYQYMMTLANIFEIISNIIKTISDVMIYD